MAPSYLDHVKSVKSGETGVVIAVYPSEGDAKKNLLDIRLDESEYRDIWYGSPEEYWEVTDTK